MATAAETTTEEAATTATETAATETAATEETAATTETETTEATETAATEADWRARIAGDDEKLLKHLGRYQSEKSFAEAARKDREAARRAVKPLGEDASEEDVAAYREVMGVPEKPEGYLEKLPDGLVVGDDDKPYVDQFLTKMHEANAPKAAVDKALAAYYAIVEEQANTAVEVEKLAKSASEDALREEWGADYRRNLNAVSSFLDTAPAEVKEAIEGGYGPDGVSLANNAAVIKWLTSLALDKNPLHTVVPGAADQASAVADEIAKIKEVMRTNRAKYDRDEAMQARYRDLLRAQERMAA